MSLGPGSRLGPYEIVSAIGAVADPERRERFAREAQAIATLNHPNIVTIHSIEEIDGLSLITMELVEGQPLANHVPSGGFIRTTFPTESSRLQTADRPRAPLADHEPHSVAKPSSGRARSGGEDARSSMITWTRRVTT